MNLGYKKSRTISTDDLPGVICDPPIDIEFVNLITNEQTQKISYITRNFDNADIDMDMVVELAESAIVAVIDQDGERYEIGSHIAIQGLIDQTENRFLVAVISGWVMLIAAEIMESKKKSRRSKIRSISTAKAG